MNTRDAVPGLLDRQPEVAADEEVKVVGSCHWAKKSLVSTLRSGKSPKGEVTDRATGHAM